MSREEPIIGSCGPGPSGADLEELRLLVPKDLAVALALARATATIR